MTVIGGPLGLRLLPLWVPFSKEQYRKMGPGSWVSKGQACDLNTASRLRLSQPQGSSGCGL